jgi:hypothetical protein
VTDVVAVGAAPVVDMDVESTSDGTVVGAAGVTVLAALRASISPALTLSFLTRPDLRSDIECLW